MLHPVVHAKHEEEKDSESKEDIALVVASKYVGSCVEVLKNPELQLQVPAQLIRLLCPRSSHDKKEPRRATPPTPALPTLLLLFTKPNVNMNPLSRVID
jgi:hypothetical protein